MNFSRYYSGAFDPNIILNTLIISLGEEYKYLTYNNNYFYEMPQYSTNNDFIFFDPRIVMCHQKTKKVLLLNEKHFEFVRTEELFVKLIDSLKKGKICMPYVDLYYLIENSGNYKKNHIVHSALISRVDLKKQTFYAFETGNMGYEEFEISILDLYQAVNAAGNKMVICNRGKEAEKLKYSLKDVIMNSFAIEKSIDFILCHENDVWNLNNCDVTDIPYFFDNCIIHLNSIRYRQKANRLLAKTFDLMQEKDFGKLEEQYEILKGRVRKYYNQNKLKDGINQLKKEYMDALFYEKNTWCAMRRLL